MQLDIFDELKEDHFKLENEIALIEFFGGVGSQHKALERVGFKIVDNLLYEVDVNAAISYAAINCGLSKYMETKEIRSKEYYLQKLLPNLSDYRNYEKYIQVINEIAKVDKKIEKATAEIKEIENDEDKDTYEWQKEIEKKEKVIYEYENNVLPNLHLEKRMIESCAEIEIIKNVMNKYWKDEQPYAISKMDIKRLAIFYHSLEIANNKTNIFELKVNDLNEFIKKHKDAVLTWSTPCQEFSMAGNRGGFDTYKGSLTGVSLDIFEELEDKPSVLMFENVPGIKSGEFKEGFEGMVDRLKKIGYENAILEINATEQNIPQNRKRVFIVSVLKTRLRESFLIFPKEKKLERTLKTMLENVVDIKYYLNQEKLDAIIFEEKKLGDKKIGYALKSREFEMQGFKDISPTLDTMQGGDRQPKMLVPTLKKNSNVPGVAHYDKVAIENRIYEPEISKTISCNLSQHPNYLVNVGKSENFMAGRTRIRKGETAATIRTKPGGGDEALMVKSMVKCGYEEAKDGDGIYINRPHQKRGVVQEQKIQTIKTSPDVGVVLYENEEFNVRKLTPKECWRLMGFSDSDYNEAEKYQSETALYKQAGNSIVVDVLEAIFKCMKKE